MSKQPRVLFSEPNEFVAEIVRGHQRGLVDRGIVRVTKVGRPSMNGTLTRVTVEAAGSSTRASSDFRRCAAT